MEEMWLTLCVILALSISAVVLHLIHPLSPRMGLMDHPGERRRIHRQAVPRIGGIAVFVGASSGLLLAQPLDVSQVYALLGATLLVVVGVIDDCWRLGARVRLVGQVAAALLLTLGGGMTLTSLGNLLGFGPIELGPLAIPFTVFAAVGIINAMNMIDGIDGLAGGLALMVLIILLILAPAIGPTQVMMLTTIAALLPYMLCNLELPGCRQRKVFLGDAGSMLLGYLIVWALIDSTKSSGGIQPVTAIWLVAIPLSDTLAVMGRRMLQARHPFGADRGHLHHLLARIFHSTRKALVLMLVSAGLLAGLGLVGLILQVPEPVMFYSSMLIFTLYLIALYATRSLYRRLRQRAQGLVPNRSAKRSN